MVCSSFIKDDANMITFKLILIMILATGLIGGQLVFNPGAMVFFAIVFGIAQAISPDWR